MEIEGKKLKDEHKWDRVTYIPPHAKGNASHKDVESGVIKSWNDTFVFVEYGTGTAKATRPQDLKWG